MASKALSTILLTVCLAGAFFSSLILVREHGMYVSPDETANSVFAILYAEEGKLALREPLNSTLGDVLHPRSVFAREGMLVPSGFLGIPLLYGMFGKMFGVWAIPLFTSLLACAGACAWWGIVRRMFDRTTATLATILLAFHPAWWYYSARALMPNVPFAACVLLAIWWGLAKPFASFFPGRLEKLPWIDAAISGVFFGIALLIRPAELPWMLFAGCVGYVILRPRIKRVQLYAFFSAIVLTLLPLLPFHAALYGHPLATGYTPRPSVSSEVTLLPEGVQDALSMASAPEWWGVVQRVASPVFPFGIHPRNALRAVSAYGLGLFWWMSLLAAVGVWFAIPDRTVAREVRMRRYAFLGMSLCISIWLFILYGSWTIHDNPDPSAVSIANSYVRYWLPFFLVTTVPAALAIQRFAKRFFRGAMALACMGIILCISTSLSIQATFFAPHDGLVSVARTLSISREIKERLLALTEEDAVVVVDRGDKLFFPERSVLYPLRSERTYALLPRITLLAPLYYYGITFPEVDLAYLNDEKLAELGLRIDLVETFNEETLYRITPVSLDASPL